MRRKRCPMQALPSVAVGPCGHLAPPAADPSRGGPSRHLCASRARLGSPSPLQTSPARTRTKTAGSAPGAAAKSCRSAGGSRRGRACPRRLRLPKRVAPAPRPQNEKGAPTERSEQLGKARGPSPDGRGPGRSPDRRHRRTAGASKRPGIAISSLGASRGTYGHGHEKSGQSYRGGGACRAPRCGA